jgi:uncharacterized membrane protein YdjX (TVP38/TMEM64 family)
MRPAVAAISAGREAAHSRRSVTGSVYSRWMDTRHAPQLGVSRGTVIRRMAIYAAAVGTVFAVALLTGSLPSPDEARDWGDGLGDFAYVAFVPLFVIVNFVVTWPILAGAAGLLFGTAVGTPLALAGVICASLVQMFVARRLAAGHHGNLLPQRTKGIEDFLTRHGAVAVMESRIVPLLPWGLVNYSAGLTRLHYRDLAVGTLIGGAPKVFAYTALGGSLGNLDSPKALVAIALLAALALAGALFVRRQIALGRTA